jgi:DNA-binding NtrC family response regulator
MSAYGDQVDAFKRRLLINVLAAVGNNRTKAAKRLGLHRTYLQRLIVEMKIVAPRTKATA